MKEVNAAMDKKATQRIERKFNKLKDLMYQVDGEWIVAILKKDPDADALIKYQYNEQDPIAGNGPRENCTLLHFAAHAANVKAVEGLIELNANPHQKAILAQKGPDSTWSWGNSTALEIARRHGSAVACSTDTHEKAKEIITMLRQAMKEYTPSTDQAADKGKVAHR